MTKPYLVFFSHGGEDKYIVENFLTPKLETTGAVVFVDAGGLTYGDDFRERILAKLQDCDELVVLITRSSLGRCWVSAEVGIAIALKKRIVGVVYGPTDGELQELGMLSLLGSTLLLRLERFDEYVSQLTTRVEGHHA